MMLRAFRTLLYASLVVTLSMAGCGPSAGEPIFQYYARQYRVTDPAARHTTLAWNLRFDAALLSDLEDLLDQNDHANLLQQATDILQKAMELARVSTGGEIDRLPTEALELLAQFVGTDANTGALKDRFDQLAETALNRDLEYFDSLSMTELVLKLDALVRGVEPLPDDRGRLGRKLVLAWGAIPAWIGLEREEAKLASKIEAKVKRAFDQVAIWKPQSPVGDDELSRYAPTLAIEWPSERPYPEAFDRIGRVRLSGTRENISVAIDPADPVVYCYKGSGKIHGQRYRQLIYVWWFQERPPMTPDDPAAGHVDGGTMRVTLNRQGSPLLVETSLNCGCGHQVFVSETLEKAARQAFGDPLPGKRWAIEKMLPGKHDVVVVNSFAPLTDANGPTIYLVAGYHEVCRVSFADALEGNVSLGGSYKLKDYGLLDRLPLGDGVGSMFGPDGLVHRAGRPEGFLLAPTGILSAGQPRKRGTQRIRWDDFLFDDPHLLERTLRLPSGL